MKKVSLDKEDLNSFRPITNLAFESNVIERIAACQVPHHYLVSNNLYPKLQPAFQQSDNTETASYGYIMILNEDMILALAGQFKQLSHEPEKFR